MVPLRTFTSGKERLSGHLDDPARADLARRLADTVMDAAGDLPVVVVTSAPEVLEWARHRGAATVEDPGSLDTAADAGRRWAREQGFSRVVVSHGDLAHVRSFTLLGLHAGVDVVTLVPDHRGDGTPVLSLPVGADFHFSYGEGSFRRHCAEANRLGAGLRVLRRPDLAFDVDLPEDLDLMTTPAP